MRQNNKQTDELQDELDSYRKTVADLKKKLAQHERDNNNFQNCIAQLENEVLVVGSKWTIVFYMSLKFVQKSELEKNVSKLYKENKEITKELFDVKLEGDTKDAQINHFSKVFKDMDSKLKEQKDLNDQLKEEVDVCNCLILIFFSTKLLFF